MAPKDSNAVPVAAESDKKKDGDSKIKKPDDDGNDNLSEEDRELKERLETCVSTVINENNEENVTIPIRLTALDVIVTELRTATSSMTSVPKPLKFLRPHFASIKTLYKTFEQSTDLDNDTLELRARLADVLAVLAMTMGKPGTCQRRTQLSFSTRNFFSCFFLTPFFVCSLAYCILSCTEFVNVVMSREKNCLLHVPWTVFR